MIKITPMSFIEKKQKKQPLVMLAAYDYIFAGLIDENGVDAILIGDSLGNTFCGYETTIPVSLEQIIYHTKCVINAANKALVVADMPFMSYQVSSEEAIRNAGRLMKEGGAHCVKLEVSSLRHVDIIKDLVDAGISVMGHIGFTPQIVHMLGGYKIQGKSQTEQQKLIELAKKVEKAGAFSIVLELIPQGLSQQITAALEIPTIGIGAGPECDGQVLVLHDLLGLTPNNNKKFIKKYADLRNLITEAITEYAADVREKRFPGKDNSY